MAQTAVQNDFSKGSLWRIILNQSVPLMVAQLVHVLYNVVDRVYLGHLPGASSLALTGVGLIFPIVALVSAFCALFSTGGAPLCAIARGAGEKERAEKLLNNTFSMLLILCMTLGLCTAAAAQSTNAADFEALVPLMDLVCSASQYSPNAPESVPGADGQLTVSFTDAFFKVGAIHGTVKNPHEIDQNACIKCGTCYEKCKFNAISIK